MSLKDQVWIALTVAATGEQISAAVFDRGCLGLEERDGEVVAYFEEGSHVPALTVLERDYAVRVERVPYGDWADGWKKHFVPTRIGERLIVRPSWEEVEPEERDVIVTIDPGIAFGTGTHETTRMCLEEIEHQLTAGARVLDVGCGTAILSIAAVKLGAGLPVVAIDIDEDAMTSAGENLERNDVVGKVHLSTTPVRDVRGVFDLVVANILADKLIAIAEALKLRVAPGGMLILSGLSVAQRADVEAVFRWPVKTVRSLEPWVLLGLQHF